MSSTHDVFEARPSNRVGVQEIQADGDTWQETLAVCEAAPTSVDAGKLVIRSYYQNMRSGQRVWDEPPSGASNISPASEEMRRMANIQLSELQVVTGEVNDINSVSKSKKKRGLFGFLRKEKKTPPRETRKIQYKPGSKFFARKGQHPPTSSDNDAQLQEAIARSLAIDQGDNNQKGLVGVSLENPPVDDEELAMAKALSMSEATKHGETEEQIIQRVLEQSKKETSALQKQQTQAREGDLLGICHTVDQQSSEYHEEDRKMPAKTQSKQISPPFVAEQSKSLHGSPFAASSAAVSDKSTKISSAVDTTKIRLKSPPSYSIPVNDLKIPPGSTSPSKSPVAMFDPYAKDTKSQFHAKEKESTLDNAQNVEASLQKMSQNSSNSSTVSMLTFGKRTSKKKMQDKAGLV